jgi:hypothetical protein
MFNLDETGLSHWEDSESKLGSVPTDLGDSMIHYPVITRSDTKPSYVVPLLPEMHIAPCSRLAGSQYPRYLTWEFAAG